MKTKLGNLGLTIPILDPELSPSLDWQVAAVQKWCKTLPMSSVGKSAKLLFNSLQEFSVVPLEPAQRFEICDAFRFPVQWMCFSLRKYYLNKVDDLTDYDLIIANLAQSLHYLLTLNYKAVVEALADKNAPGLNKRLLPTAIYRIMHYYDLMLLRSFQLYEQIPSVLWRELHSLYQFAEKINALKETMIDDDSLDEAKHTILSGYKKALLLAICNPYEWRQNEQEIINNILYKWEPLTRLRVISLSDKNKAETFIINLASGEGPVPMVGYHGSIHEHCLVMDLSALTHSLGELFKARMNQELDAQAQQGDTPEYQLSLSTLEHLLSEWTTTVPIAYKKCPIEGQVRVTFGINAIAQAIGQGRREGTRCTVLNDLPECSRLRWQEDNQYPALQSGELLGFTIDGSVWHLAVVRWMKHDANHDFNLGVAYLGQCQQLLTLEIFKQDKFYDLGLLGLLCQDVEASQQSIVMPTVPYKQGKRVRLSCQASGNLLGEYILPNHLEATDKFKQFPCNLDINPPTAAPKQADAKSDLRVSLHAPLPVAMYEQIWEQLQ